MSNRITEKMLQVQIDYLNELTGSPMEPYSRDEKTGKSTANIGNFNLSHAYGGVCVHRITSPGGGVDTPITYGHCPKREVYDQLTSYIAGIQFAMENK